MSYIKAFLPTLVCFSVAAFLVVFPTFALAVSVVVLVAVGAIYAIAAAGMIQAELEAERNAARSKVGTSGLPVVVPKTSFRTITLRLLSTRRP